MNNARFVKSLHLIAEHLSYVTGQQYDQLLLSLSQIHPLMFPVSTLDMFVYRKRGNAYRVSRLREVSSSSLLLLGQTKPGTTSHWAQPRLSHTHTQKRTHKLSIEGRRQGRESEHEREFKPLSLSFMSTFSSILCCFSVIFFSVFLQLLWLKSTPLLPFLNLPIHPSIYLISLLLHLLQPPYRAF